jgi:uncharacterized protein (DUF1800 family)
MHATKHRKKTFSLLDTNAAEVGHLLRRAGFGEQSAQIQTAAAQGLGVVADRLVDYEQTPDTFTPPPDAILMTRRYDPSDLTAWWLNRMVTTTRPLQEKMTLFWHGHFATAIQKVGDTRFMYRQNQLFRDNALGRFDDLLVAVYQDPAMMIWLDGEQNIKTAPNENYGREVMELFTLGIGNYTEDDVHAAARAFTGWRLNRQTGDVTFIPRLHDFSPKTFLGQTGDWNGDDVSRILAAHPATGRFLATKLWTFFASDQPPQSALQKLSDAYYGSDHLIHEMVRTLFTIPEFYATSTRTGHIKSPVEFVVGSIVQLGLANVDLRIATRTLTLLGQQLFNPPNVGGWPAGASWINAATMLGRFNFASYLTGDNATRAKGLVDIEAMLAATGAGPDDAINSATRSQIIGSLAGYVSDALGISLTGATRTALLGYMRDAPMDTIGLEAKLRGMLHLALVSPEYQAS